MGDTDRDTACDSVCGTGRAAVAIFGVDLVYRCSSSHDLFPDDAVPPTNPRLGYAK